MARFTKCIKCNKEVKEYGKQNRRFCSYTCRSQYNAKYGKDNPAWKGNNVGYDGIHRWVRRQLGTPSQCEHCQTTTASKFEWANVSHEYKRDVTDWVRLCTKCHAKYDDYVNKSWVTRRRMYG